MFQGLNTALSQLNHIALLLAMVCVFGRLPIFSHIFDVFGNGSEKPSRILQLLLRPSSALTCTLAGQDLSTGNQLEYL